MFVLATVFLISKNLPLSDCPFLLAPVLCGGSNGADIDKAALRGSPLFLIIPFPLRGLSCKLSPGSGLAAEDSNEWARPPCLPWE